MVDGHFHQDGRTSAGWFPWIAGPAIVAAIAFTGHSIFTQVDGGALPWAAYPALFGVIGAILAMDRLFSR